MQSIAWWPVVLAVIVAAIFDIRTRRIPNWLVFSLLPSGIIVSTITSGWSGLTRSVSGALLASLLMGLLYLLGGMGMGDVKLCAGVGAWIGPHQLLFALVFMGLAGALMAFVWAICGGFLAEMLSGAGDLILGFRKRGFRPHDSLVLENSGTRKMPYAPAIAVGAMLSFFAVS
jgi:prepilin peptidase CpaA